MRIFFKKAPPFGLEESVAQREVALEIRVVG
jgi:hypothetical protein